MRKITVLTLAALSSWAVAKPIHVREQGRMAEIPTHAPIMTRQAAIQRQNIRVRNLQFNRQGVAHLAGHIRGLGMAAYRFHGQAGQQVKIVPIGNNYAMEFGLFDRIRGMHFGTTHILPTTGEYEVRIVQTRKNAARNRKAYRYQADVFLGHQSAPKPRRRASAGIVSAPPLGAVINFPSQNARRVVPTSTPLEGKRSGKISTIQFPRHQVPTTNRRHVHYSDDPVISSHRQDRKQAAAQKTTVSTPKETITYRCQSGNGLTVSYSHLQSNPRAEIKGKTRTVHLQKDQKQSKGKNLILTGEGGVLHLRWRKGKFNIATAELLSFEYNGQTVSFGCKK